MCRQMARRKPGPAMTVLVLLGAAFGTWAAALVIATGAPVPQLGYPAAVAAILTAAAAALWRWGR